MRWVPGILAITIAAPAAAQHVQITLPEAIQRALQVQPAMVQARGDESNAGGQRLAAIGAFVPTVTLNSAAFRQNAASIVNGLPAQAGTYTYNTGLSLNLDLFDGLRRLQRYRNAAATAEAANAGYTNQRFQVTLQTKQAFYNALATEELVRVVLDPSTGELAVDLVLVRERDAVRGAPLGRAEARSSVCVAQHKAYVDALRRCGFEDGERAAARERDRAPARLDRQDSHWMARGQSTRLTYSGAAVSPIDAAASPSNLTTEPPTISEAISS